jgi:Phage protein (N4 Gp49/phage Sf6 gene 66) family
LRRWRDRAPRVSLDDVKAAIACRYELTGQGAAMVAIAVHGPSRHSALDNLSICILVLRNGWTVIGKSAVVSAENFKPNLAAISRTRMLSVRSGR